jgi:transaldolase
MIQVNSSMKVKIFSDGADTKEMIEMAQLPYIQGLTTNPTLMKKSGITNYEKFALEVLGEIKNKPISFEVFSDDFIEMEIQAKKIASWGENVYVKIPVSNTSGKPTSELIKKLTDSGIKVNVTAVMTINQVKVVLKNLNPQTKSYISIFAGRIADTGRDPMPIMVEALNEIKEFPSTELIWASPRELLNVIQADQINCHIITATKDILNKLSLIGKSLEEYSLETVKMFRNDAILANYSL